MKGSRTKQKSLCTILRSIRTRSRQEQDKRSVLALSLGPGFRGGPAQAVSEFQEVMEEWDAPVEDVVEEEEGDECPVAVARQELKEWSPSAYGLPFSSQIRKGDSDFSHASSRTLVMMNA